MLWPLPTKLESEQLLKLFFAEHGTTAQARATVDGVAAWAAERVAENIAVAKSYLDGTGPFPERAAILAVIGKLMTDFADMMAAWADWAASVLAHWPDDPADAEPDWSIFEAIAHRATAAPPTAQSTTQP